MNKKVMIIIGLGGVMAIIGIMFLSLYFYSLGCLRMLPKEKTTIIHGITTIDDAVEYFKSSGLKECI